jgi:hypothetical protein
MRASSSAAACLAAGVVLLLACSNEGPSTIASGGPASGSTSGTPAGQPRSFRKDVVPILTGSCALSQCHGDRTGNPGVGIYLPLGDPDGIYADLMKDSRTAKGVKFVVPRDPANSFLYGKVIGDLSAFMSACPTTGCGDSMPPGTKVSSADRDTIKLWITEGAANN